MIRIVYLTTIMLLCLVSSSSAQYKQTLINKTELISNKNQIIPLKRLDEYKIAVVSTDNQAFSPFIDQLQRYGEVTPVTFDQFDENTKYFNTIIIAVNDKLRSDYMSMILQAAVNNKQVILCQFGSDNLYTKVGFDQSNLTPYLSILKVGNNTTELQQHMAMSIFGGLGITQGNNKTTQSRIQYGPQNNTGLDLEKMAKGIDAIAQEAVDGHAAPGLTVMAVKDGQVIFEKAYGYHTYEKKQANAISDIYDLASISKIVGTTPVIMHLQENNTINLDSTMGHYLWQAKKSNKANITLRTVLLHEAGFTPFIPFYRNLKAGDVTFAKDETHQVQIAEHAFIKNNYYRDIMWPEMLASSVKPIGNYVYSDISMYVMKEVAEHETAVPMQDYVQDLLYRPIGMKTAGYLPRQRFEKNRIVPTQNDTVFRKELLQGYVHDEGAAMAGGIAGHAGLFASANDLAIYGQLLLNRGEYGGVQYFKPETVDLFTSKQSKTSRRGLGFDRYEDKPNADYPSKLADPSVFGHTGYTGTCIWIDPSNQLIYIFLSNRVHPQVSTKLYELNIRSRIQDLIYQTIQNQK